MLRIINNLLKRVSKTEDFLIRGELQVALTKILTICHDSGFHYRFQPMKITPILKENDEKFDEEFKNRESINEKYFENFWELQRFFGDPNELAYEGEDR